MWWTVFTCCVALGLVNESYRRLRAVRALWQIAEPHLEAGARVGASAPSAPERAWVADLNEATVDIGAGLAGAGGVPKSCAKAALSLGALVALLQSAEFLQGERPALWVAPAASFVGGCVGALGCLFIGRAADAEARRLRATWATLIRRSARDVPT
jgi:hypothetical protein